MISPLERLRNRKGSGDLVSNQDIVVDIVNQRIAEYEFRGVVLKKASTKTRSTRSEAKIQTHIIYKKQIREINQRQQNKIDKEFIN